MSISSTDLLNIDTCDVFNYVSNVKGLPSKSASPTDTLLLDFKNNVVFDDKKVNSAFMKIYVSKAYYDTLDEKGKKVKKEMSIDDNKKKAGLINEQKIYELIRLLIRLQYCPYFVQIYSNAIDCGFNDYKRLLEKHTGISLAMAKKLATRASYYMIYEGEDRPSSTDIVDEFNKRDIDEKETYTDYKNNFENNFFVRKLRKIRVPYILPNMEENKYNFMINESIDGEVGSNMIKFYLNKYIQKNDVDFNRYVNMICLQLFIALYGLELLKFIHYDLHAGNFWITNVPRKIIKYKIEDKIYEFDNLGIEVKIYDYDFSYFEPAGKNEFLTMTESSSLWTSDTCLINKFQTKIDILKVMFTLKNHFDAERIILGRNIRKEISDERKKDIPDEKKINDLQSTYDKLDNEITDGFDLEYEKIERLLNINYETDSKSFWTSNCRNINLYKSKVRNSFDILKGQLRECGAIESKNDIYDYKITKQKADLILKYSKILIEVFSSKLTIGAIKEIGDINRKCARGFLKIEDCSNKIAEIKVRSSKRSVSEPEREALVSALTEIVEGRTPRCLSEEDFKGKPSYLNYFGDYFSYLRSNPICGKKPEKEQSRAMKTQKKRQERLFSPY